ncbi:alpha/beta fold hydrolase [Leptolyngbya iicbica]|uniref:Alpha/beta hydrolase n=2 Tax=Cyanophyceae TaxID=3028117 RepID=A0A4Q7EF20_9CYAN|nr:alpha/beta hydrolase [Leptolyngbya sp. LK]RZM81845.1 alpha/beta hydrolase [Leptolyngbya sp. LK]
MTYANVFGVPHAYRLTAPANPPSATLVFIHGWLLSQCYWQPVIEQLAADFQCLSYDLRGFGASNQAVDERSHPTLPSRHSSSPHPYSLEAYAEDLGELLNQLELTSPVWLVGHSLGGSIALWAAKLFPQQIQGVICVNAGGGVYLPDEFAQFRQAGKQIVRWRPAWLRHLPLINWAFTRMMVQQPLMLNWGQQRVADLLAAQATAATGVLLESTTEAEVHRLPQVVANLQQPAYFIAGADDTVMEVKYVNHLASFHPLFESVEGNVKILPDCGHMAMVEQPEALTETIQKLVTIAPVSSPVRDSALK